MGPGSAEQCYTLLRFRDTRVTIAYVDASFGRP